MQIVVAQLPEQEIVICASSDDIIAIGACVITVGMVKQFNMADANRIRVFTIVLAVHHLRDVVSVINHRSR